jgi:hypothetical protein
MSWSKGTLVENFNDAIPVGNSVEHLGPASVVNDKEALAIHKTGGHIASLETSEEVFLRENFEQRDYFDSSLEVQHQIAQEMEMPVTEMFIHNNEPTDDLQPENRSVKTQKVDQKIKLGIGLAIAYFIFTKK